MRKKIILLTVLCMGMILSACGTQKEEVTELNISVAASLVNPIDEMIELYTKDHPVKINVNSGGSGTLKKQISEGADIGLFFSANEKYVVELIDEGLVKPSNKSNLIYNTLVVIKNKEAQTLNSLLDIKENGSMLAIGEVSTVPAGEYAKESLTNLGLWDELESSLIYGKDVTAVKTYVERGEVDY
ncbi:molybdate ABC transporter substrate-binding protein, partial [Turicibacter sanguinis]|nr:molybdate ABC transporter substrate-binding protein [Turicibacter sanguinis]